MVSNEVLWDDLDLELITRVSKLELTPTWNLIVQSMVLNFLYSIRKAVEDGLKNNQNFKI